MNERFQDKRERRLQKAAIALIGLTAVTGCGGGGETAPSANVPTEQAPAPTLEATESTLPEEAPTATEVSEAPAEFEVTKIDLTDSAIYNRMSNADKKTVDAYMKMSMKEFRNLYEEDQNILSAVLMSAGEKMYLDSVKDVEIDQWGPLSNYQESKGSDVRLDLSKKTFDAAMYTPANTVRAEGPRDESGYYPTNFVEDGWVYAEAAPYIQTNIAVGIAFELAASGIPANLEAAKRIIIGSMHTDRDTYSSGGMIDIEDELLASLDSVAKSGVYDDPMKNWPRTDIYARELDSMPHRLALVFDDADVAYHNIGPNESGEAAAWYVSGARVKLSDGEVAQGWMQSYSFKDGSIVDATEVSASREGGTRSDGDKTRGIEVNSIDY